MDRILSVVVPAISHDLTTIEIARDELGVTATEVSDTKLSRWIKRESEIIAGKLQRVLGLETVSETFVQDPCSNRLGDPIRLTRFPVTTVDSVTLNGTVRDPAAYEFDADSGLLWALGTSGARTAWSWQRAVVVYSAGFLLPAAVPGALEKAVLSQLQWRWSTAGRDPAIRSESVEGVGDITYQVGGIGGDDAALTPEACSLIDEFRDYGI